MYKLPSEGTILLQGSPNVPRDMTRTNGDTDGNPGPYINDEIVVAFWCVTRLSVSLVSLPLGLPPTGSNLGYGRVTSSFGFEVRGLVS